jgi:uncharacterized membrane protein YvbJ
MMALVTCRECGKQVSDAASACPQCGAPVVHRDEVKTPTPVITTQQTSKRLKFYLLLALGLFVVGAVMSFSSSNTGSKEAVPIAGLLMVAGIVLGIVTKVRSWWHHG